MPNELSPFKDEPSADMEGPGLHKEKLSNPMNDKTAESVSKPGTDNVKKSNFHTWIDTLNKLVQIVAVLIAGMWTWSVFARTSAPGLESKLSLRCELNWTETADKHVCNAVFHVSAKNDGQRGFDISEVTIQGYALDLATLPKPPETGDPILLDSKFIENYGRKLKLSDAVSFLADLDGHYAPGTQNDSEITFQFGKRSNQLIEFRAYFAGKESRVLLPFAAMQPVSNYTSARDQLCGQNVS